MRPLTYYVAKAMIPVAGRPILEHIVLKLRDHGLDEIIVALSTLDDQVRHYFGDGARFGVRLAWSVSDRPLGTAGEVHNLHPMLAGEEHFLVHYGDILTDLDTRRLVQEHLAHAADATLGLVTGVPVHTGIAELDRNGQVTSFVEKPPLYQPCNAAVFALGKTALDLCAPDRDFSTDVFPEMIARGMKVRGFVDERAYWLDVGRLSDLDSANELLGDESRER